MSASAAAALSIIWRARPISPAWFSPISAMIVVVPELPIVRGGQVTVGSVSQPWHPHVFDSERRRFVGDFEGMYRAEAEQGFDSWHQSDPRRLDSRVAGLLLDQITFRSALDLGCGKGQFAASLRRRDNRVVGVDASETAIGTARSYYPDLEWVCADVQQYVAHSDAFDLIVARELLSYVEGWRELLAACADRCRYLLLGLYVPADPIGFVKSHAELEQEAERRFELLEGVMLTRRSLVIGLYETRSSSAS